MVAKAYKQLALSLQAENAELKAQLEALKPANADKVIAPTMYYNITDMRRKVVVAHVPADKLSEVMKATAARLGVTVKAYPSKI